MRYKNKFGARKITIKTERFGVVKFDSKKEALRCSELEILERAGKISELKRQVKFALLNPFKIGKNSVRGIFYIADFTYKNEAKKLIIEDVKGYKTKEYLIKKKLLLSLIFSGQIDALFLES